VLRDPGRRARLGRGAVRHARNFSWARTAAGLLAVMGGTAFGLIRWRSAQQDEGAARDMVAAYQGATTVQRALTARFNAGTLPGSRFLFAQDSLAAALDRRTPDSILGALPEESRGRVEAAMDNFWLAKLEGIRLEPRTSEVAGCRLERLARAVRLSDGNPGDNCWYGLMSSPGAVGSPIEYFLNFSVPDELPRGAGIGLAWCAGAASCRVAFLWSSGIMEWGTLRTGSNLRTIQLGNRLPALTGSHRLRVREQGQTMSVYLDDTLVLRRPATDDLPYISEPGSLRLVVQNATVELQPGNAMGVVGSRKL